MDNQAISKVLPDIYRRLMARYGPQHWWPAEGRFEVLVGAILTQSATWSNVEKAINNLKAAKALSAGALNRLSLAEIAALIHPCGYFNVKALKLKSLVCWLRKNCDNSLDKLFDKSTDCIRQQLLSIHGIGEETADSIMLYAASRPIFVIDAYTRRIIDRLGLSPNGRNYATYQVLFMENLPADVQLFNEYHALLVCLGKHVCRHRPHCQQCCLNDICQFYSKDYAEAEKNE